MENIQLSEENMNDLAQIMMMRMMNDLGAAGNWSGIKYWQSRFFFVILFQLQSPVIHHQDNISVFISILTSFHLKSHLFLQCFQRHVSVASELVPIIDEKQRNLQQLWGRKCRKKEMRNQGNRGNCRKKKSSLDSFAISIFCSSNCPVFDNGLNLLWNPDWVKEVM